jgi:hypothetical protein
MADPTREEIMKLGKEYEETYRQLKPALLRWLQSQDINPNLWAPILCRLGAQLMVEHAQKTSPTKVLTSATVGMQLLKLVMSLELVLLEDQE